MRTLVPLFACWVCVGLGQKRGTQHDGRSSGDHLCSGKECGRAANYHASRELKQLLSKSRRVSRSLEVLARLVLAFSHPAPPLRGVGRGRTFARCTPHVTRHGLSSVRSSTRLYRPAFMLENGASNIDSRVEVCKHAKVTHHLKGAAEHAWNVMKALLRRRWCLFALGFAVAALIFNAGEASAVVDAASSANSAVDFQEIFRVALKQALGGGMAGAGAAVIQVVSLMWLNTALNYQYRHGGDLRSTLATLTKEGGIGRLYQGVQFALIEGPVVRFGTTAANAGVRAFMSSVPATADLGMPIRIAAVSITGGLWRILTMPVGTCKVALQVGGREGLSRLRQRVLEQGPAPLYKGALTSALATAGGLYPWLLTYGYLDNVVPLAANDVVLLSLLRNAVLGFSASCVSTVVTNSLRIIKTTQQAEGLNIREAVSLVMETDGVRGLFSRGLRTKILLNALQESFFTVFWKYFESLFQVKYK